MHLTEYQEYYQALSKTMTNNIFIGIKRTLESLAIVTGIIFLYIIISAAIHWNNTVAIVQYMKNERHSIDASFNDSINRKINQELTTLKTTTGYPDRISFNKFHNGIQDLQGIHFVYLSRTNEVDTNSNSYMTTFQNIPSSIFLRDTNTHIKNKCVQNDLTDSKNDYAQFFKNMHTEYVISCPVFDGENLIGNVMLEYKNKISPENGEEYMKNTKLFVSRITQDIETY